jgi:hypothetical protein
MANDFYGKGILGGPIDLDGGRHRRRDHPRVEAVPGLEVEERGSGVSGTVVSLAKGVVTIRGSDGRDRPARLRDGAFNVQGRQVTLVPARPAASRAAAARRTASGSIAVAGARARIARASRILVEGAHDAELVEKVWGDDLRVEGVVVELLEGADHLDEVVRRFGPRPGRRLGILLDHLVTDSKESRIAAGIDHPDVLVTGHPYVDIWAAVKPRVLGLDAWPDIPKGQSWKEGICARVGPRLGGPRTAGPGPAGAGHVGAASDPRLFWKRLLGAVGSWTDLEPALVGAVEQLIDFVTEPS